MIAVDHLDNPSEFKNNFIIGPDRGMELIDISLGGVGGAVLGKVFVAGGLLVFGGGFIALFVVGFGGGAMEGFVGFGVL